MPVLTAQKQLQRDGVRGFLGVNLRRDRLDLADGDVARAINADLHRTPGVAVLRLGMTAQFTTSLGTAIRRLAKLNGVRYQVAGTALYADQTNILSGLSGGQLTTLQPFRPLNDPNEWVYIADDALMRKHDGTNVREWGIAAPLTTPIIAGGSGTGLTGDYKGVYRYVRLVNGTVVTESNQSPEPAAAVTLSNTDFEIAVYAATDAQVTNIEVYRTVAGGTAYLFDQRVANTTATIISTQADTALGVAIETDNNPPNAMGWVTQFQGHLFMCRDSANPHYLWWSKRFREEVPSSNFLEIGAPSDPLQGALPLAGFLGVFSRETKYRVIGNQTSGFTWLEALSSRGTPAVQAATVTARGVLFPARDGLFLTNFLEEDVELSQAIEPLFNGQPVHEYAPIDWASSTQMATAEYKGRYWFAYPDLGGGRMIAVYSRDTGRWYHYDYGRAFHSLYVEEDVDELVGGSQDGLVYVLEDALATGDLDGAIAIELQPATRAGRDVGLEDIRKHFQYFKADIDAKTGTAMVAVYVDDVLIRTYPITGTREPRLLRLPGNILGYRWRVVITYTGTDMIEIYGIPSMLYVPLEAA